MERFDDVRREQVNGVQMCTYWRSFRIKVTFEKLSLSFCSQFRPTIEVFFPTIIALLIGILRGENTLLLVSTKIVYPFPSWNAVLTAFGSPDPEWIVSLSFRFRRRQNSGKSRRHREFLGRHFPIGNFELYDTVQQRITRRNLYNSDCSSEIYRKG